MAMRHRYTNEEYLEAATFRIKYKDYLHLRYLYIMMHEWLVEEGYASRTDSEFPEHFYLFRETQKSGNEKWIWWRTEKIPNDNNYYKYVLDIDIHVILLKDVEVIHQGQKFPTNWGEPEIKIRARLIKDYKHSWRNHWLLKHLDKVFHQRIFKKELEAHKLEFYREAYRFQEAIKTFLKLKTYLPEPELQRFWPELGLGDVR
jgi:hypothetical protein